MSLWADPYRRRWFLWAMVALVFLLVNVYRLSSAVLFDDLMVAFQTTGAQLGTLHAIFFWVYAALQIPAGMLADRLGPRATAAGGAVVMNAGAILFAASGSYGEALFGRFLIGLGASVVFISLLRFCANWYRPDEFATMNGLSFAVSGVGGIIATTPLAYAVEAVGWRPSMGALGLFGLGVGALAYVAVRNSPREAGLEPIEGVPDRSTMDLRDTVGELRAVLADRWTWVIGAMLFCTTGVNLTLFGLWGIPYVVQMYDVDVTLASTFTLLGSVALLLGPSTIGWVSDRIGRRIELVVAGTGIYIVTLGMLALFQDLPMAVVAAIYFVAGGLLGTFVLTYPIVKERHAARASGLSMGTVNGAAFLGASVLPTAMGYALDAFWTGEIVGGVRVYSPLGYRIAFGIATACAVVAFTCATLMYRGGVGR